MSMGYFSTIDLAGWSASGKRSLFVDTFSVLPTKPLCYPLLPSLLYAACQNLHIAAALHVLLWLYFGYLAAIHLRSWQAFLIGLLLLYPCRILLCARPSTLALLPLLLHLIALHKMKTKQLLLIQIFWVNLHGSFILGILMPLWQALFMRHRLRLVLQLTLVSLLNPFGWRMFSYLLETRNYAVNLFPEWAPVSLLTQFPVGLSYFLILLYWAFFGFMQSPFTLILLLGGTATRHAQLVNFLFLPALALSGTVAIRSYKRFYPCLAFVIISILACGNVLSRSDIWDDSGPLKIIETIKKTEKTCAIYNNWTTGGLIMNSLPNKLFIDSRTLPYTMDQFSFYFAIALATTDIERVFRDFNVCFAILNHPSYDPLITALQQKGWRLLMEEKGNVLLALEDVVDLKKVNE